MKLILVKVYQFLRKLLKLMRWMSVVPAQRRKLGSDHKISEDVEGRIMVLIPHSDDEWIGTSQLIGSSQEVLLCNMNMCGADTPELHHARYLEMNQHAKRFSRELIQVDHAEQLTNAIRQYQPAYVFAPFLIDWHDEHHEVLRILYDALANLSDMADMMQIGMYQVSVPMPPDAVTHHKRMSLPVWLRKWRLFLTAYPSQSSIAYQRFALQEVINGAYSHSWASEVYSVWNVRQWCNLYQNFTLDAQTRAQIKRQLNDMAQIRQYVHTLWEKKRI